MRQFILKMVQQVPCLESRFEIQDVIGRGSFGSIYKALDKTTNEIVAIKALTKPPLSDFTKWQVMRRELTLTQRLRHKNIARFYDVIEDGQDVYIVMEYLSGGSLLDYVNKTRGVSESVARKIFCQLIDGLDGVLRASRHVAAARGNERRNTDAVHVYRKQHDELNDFLHGCPTFSRMVCRALSIFFSM